MAAGRRAGESNTREQIIDAARLEFAEKGYDRTSMRAVARLAGVDPALVHHYFDGKEELFLASMELPKSARDGLTAALRVPHEQLGEALLRYMLSQWDDPALQPSMVGVLRSAATTEQASQVLREGFVRLIASELGRAAGLERPEEHVPFALSQTVGLIFVRYVLRLEPLASMPAEQIVATIGPTIQRYLDM
ncbi:MAG: TetR family transcriptional regulator [Nocardioidaceae bacterium]